MGMKSMATGKRSFVMYHDQYEIVKDLDDETIGKLMRAVFEYAEHGTEPKLDPIMRALFCAFKITLDRDIEKYNERCRKNKENGEKGGRPPKPKKTERFSEKPKKPDSDSDSDSDRDSEISNTSPSAPDAIDQCNQKPKTACSEKREITGAFDAFWALYPNKKGKGAARKAFEKALCKTDAQTISKAIRAHCASSDWKKDGGQYIPHPATWLNQERWEDELDNHREGDVTDKQMKEWGIA